MSEGTRASDDPSAVPSSENMESATPTAQRASSMALVVALGVLVVIAIAGVWWYVTSAGAAAESEARARIEELGAFVVPTSKDKPAKTVNLSTENAKQNLDAIVRELPALASVENLNARGAAVTDEQLEIIGTLDSLLALNLTDTDVTSVGMAHLTGLDNLISLELYGTKIDEAGLEPIGQIQSLKILNIGDTNVTGDLSPLLPLKNLERILAGRLELSDGVVSTLAGLPKLVHLAIPDATISEQALAELQAKKPDMQIAR